MEIAAIVGVAQETAEISLSEGDENGIEQDVFQVLVVPQASVSGRINCTTEGSCGIWDLVLDSLKTDFLKTENLKTIE